MNGFPLARLRQVLHAYRGEAAAIAAPTLARLLDLPAGDGRAIRQAVNELIESGAPIGSTTREGGGYFVIQTEAELERCLAQYRHRIEELERRIARLRDAFVHGPRQPSLLA